MTRILVIEDDQSIRDVTARILSAAGYRVLAAESGVHGIQLWREHGADLVLTDIRMADMDGLEVVRELVAAAPSLPVIVMSGDSAAGARLPRVSSIGFLRKPFLTAQLLAVVAAAVSAEPLERESRVP